jgi:hypothetical protein
MIKNILFDFGGVIINITNGSPIKMINIKYGFKD